MSSISRVRGWDGHRCGLDGSWERLGFMDDDNVRQLDGRSSLALRIVVEHDHDLDAKHTLSHHHVADRFGHVHLTNVATFNHVAFFEFHRFGTLRTKLARHDDLAPFCTTLHDGLHHTIACATACKTAEQLVSQGLSLDLWAQAAVGQTLHKKLNVVLLE